MTVETRLVADGAYSALNITGATQLGATPTNGTRTCFKVIVVVSAAAASSICDTAASSPSASAANTILTIPASTTQGTVYTLNWPCFAGLGIIPGSGVTLAVSWS